MPKRRNRRCVDVRMHVDQLGLYQEASDKRKLPLRTVLYWTPIAIALYLQGAFTASGNCRCYLYTRDSFMEAAVAAAGITSGVVTAVTATIKSNAFTLCFS